MSDENLELTEEEKLKLAEEEKLRLEEEEKLRLEEEKKEIEDKIQVLIDSVDFEELETYGRWNRELEKHEEYQEPLVHRFFHNLGFCDHIKQVEEVEGPEGQVVEVEKDVEVFWDKEAILKHLKLELDLDKAQLFVDQIASYKHNKKKGELESKLAALTQNNVYFLEAFGEERRLLPGTESDELIHHSDRIAKWDKDDLEDFEAKVLKLELAKKHMDDKEKKEKPLRERKLEYSKVDELLLEALVEKLEEGRPEKMVKYLELRKEIKHRHPIEEE